MGNSVSLCISQKRRRFEVFVHRRPQPELPQNTSLKFNEAREEIDDDDMELSDQPETVPVIPGNNGTADDVLPVPLLQLFFGSWRVEESDHHIHSSSSGKHRVTILTREVILSSMSLCGKQWYCCHALCP